MRFFEEWPPSTVLFKVNSFSFNDLAFMQSSPSNCSTFFLISPFDMNPFSSLSNPNPNLHTSQIYHLLTNWSLANGQHKKGMPPHTPSIVEFQPQWLMKQAMAGWFNIFFCGVQPTILPLLPWNSSKYALFTSLSLLSRTTQRKDVSTKSSTIANSLSWLWSITAELPKATYITDWGVQSSCVLLPGWTFVVVTSHQWTISGHRGYMENATGWRPFIC